MSRTLLGQRFGNASATAFTIPGGALAAGLALHVTVNGQPTTFLQTPASETTSITFPAAPADLAIINFYSVPTTHAQLAVLYTEATLDFDAVSDEDDQIKTVTVDGALVGDAVLLALPVLGTNKVTFDAWVSAADTVSVKAANYLIAGGAHQDLTPLTFGVLVIHR